MRRWPTTIAATVGLVVLAAGPASARPASTINPAARAAAESAVTSRLADLNARVTLVNQSPALTSGDRSGLLSELNSTIGGLTALTSTIAGETNQAAFRTEAAQVFSNFRVYALVLPQVYLVRASDELTSVVVSDLQKVEAALQSRISSEQRQGRDVSATTAPMSDLASQITAIAGDTAGLPATLLALTPAQWNANHSVVLGPRQRLGSAGTAAGQALRDVQTVRAAIQ
jgi:hypothetical protein